MDDDDDDDDDDDVTITGAKNITRYTTEDFVIPSSLNRGSTVYIYCVLKMF